MEKQLVLDAHFKRSLVKNMKEKNNRISLDMMIIVCISRTQSYPLPSQSRPPKLYPLRQPLANITAHYIRISIIEWVHWLEQSNMPRYHKKHDMKLQH